MAADSLYKRMLDVMITASEFHGDLGEQLRSQVGNLSKAFLSQQVKEHEIIKLHSELERVSKSIETDMKRENEQLRSRLKGMRTLEVEIQKLRSEVGQTRYFRNRLIRLEKTAKNLRAKLAKQVEEKSASTGPSASDPKEMIAGLTAAKSLIAVLEEDKQQLQSEFARAEERAKAVDIVEAKNEQLRFEITQLKTANQALSCGMDINSESPNLHSQLVSNNGVPDEALHQDKAVDLLAESANMDSPMQNFTAASPSTTSESIDWSSTGSKRACSDVVPEVQQKRARTEHELPVRLAVIGHPCCSRCYVFSLDCSHKYPCSNCLDVNEECAYLHCGKQDACTKHGCTKVHPSQCEDN